MLGTLDLSKPRAFVVGGGISGLLIAYELAKRDWAVEIHEASDRWGGLIQTGVTPLGSYETAAHSLLASEEVEALFHELNLKLLPLKNKQRYILRNGHMRRIPLSLFEVFSLVIRYILSRFSKAQSPETIRSWALRRLGEPALNYLINPFLRGIYAARPGELSFQAVFQKKEKSPLKQKKKRPTMKAPEHGMQSLVDGLVNALKKYENVSLRLNSPVTSLPLINSNLIITTPVPVTATFLENGFSEISDSLRKAQYAPLITATVFYRANDVPSKVKGVGVLVPEVEKKTRVLGVLFNSSSFDQRVKDEFQTTSFAVMIGGTSNSEHLNLNDAEISQIIDEDLRNILGIRVPPLSIVMTRWKNAIPVYNDQLLEAWKSANAILNKTPGLVLFGNYTGQISVRGMIESLSVLPFDKVK